MTGASAKRARAVLSGLTALVLVAGCAAAPDGGAAAGGAAAGVGAAPDSPWRGTAIVKGYPLPDERFTDTAGATVVPARDADASVTLVFFGYTSCPDICNIVLANIASALRGASPEVQRSTELLFISTDPARDTPERVREYLDRFDPAYTGLVAPVGTVEQAAKSLYISYERPDGSTGGYEVEHGAYTTAFVAGRSRVLWAQDVSVADLRADLVRLVRLARVA